MVTIKTPSASFIQFTGSDSFNHCIFGDVRHCLPIFDENDIYFQFVLQAETIEEADLLCATASNFLTIGLADDCLYDAQLITFSEVPERYRISTMQVLYNWKHGFPNFTSVIGVGECFKVQISFSLDGEDYVFCSNCFQRIAEDCFTSVLEYGNDENAFGFNYCASGAMDEDNAVSCDPTIITFTNKSTLSLPYTASLQAAYGDAPSITTWIYDPEGNLVNMGITVMLDGFPPSTMEWDFGGSASGRIIIR